MADAKSPVKPSNDIVAQVAERIKNSSNVLIALSKDPSVDELSAAIGLSFLLDELGKHATAIFSGAIPNAIEFLEPEKTFEPNTNSLQDFIIALDKEKADHLRYKIDGDYVKVYITPYRTTIDESDLEFSHGDFNVDLVIALNVPTTANLDAALSQYGRIMHDASSINITAGAPGHFGDLEWGDPAASSVSEMIYNLANRLKSKESLVNKAIATALLAGIVAATNRFSNEHTTPATMSVASQLMIAGADQQLISASIPTELVAPVASEAITEPVPVQDPSHLSVNHTNSASTPTANTATPEEQTLSQKSETSVEEPNTEAEPQGELDIQQQPEEAPEPDEQEETPEQQLEKIIQKPADNLEGSGPLMDELKEAASEKVIQPPEDFELEKPKDYSSMMDQALKEAPTANVAASAAPAVSGSAEINSVPPINYGGVPETPQAISAPTAPAPTSSPDLPTTNIRPTQAEVSNPEVASASASVSAEPTTSPLPMPDGNVLPPPPPPFDPNSAMGAVDFSPSVSSTSVPPTSDAGSSDASNGAVPTMPTVIPIAPATPEPEPEHSYLGSNPAMQDQLYPPQANDPGSFQIPGMPSA